MPGLRVTDKTQVEGTILRALAHPGPVLIDFQVDPGECVYPMVPPGAALSQTLERPKPAAQPKTQRKEVAQRR